MGLTFSKHDYCLFYGIIDDDTPSATTQHTIHVGLYTDNLVLFSESDTKESRFKKILNEKFTTDFMGNTDFFLGSSFEWNWRPDEKKSFHVSQQDFTDHTDSHFGIKDCNRIPLMTPYRSGCHIDSIPDTDPDDLTYPNTRPPTIPYANK